MKYFCLLFIMFIINGCAHTKLIIAPPTVRMHVKGNLDNINGASITVRVKWDITSK